MDATLKFNESHEWVKDNCDGTVTVGISEHAQQLLGDVVFVDLPDIGCEVVIGEGFSLIESVKAASDIYGPVNGIVIEINENLQETPELINEAPLSDGWIVKIQLTEDSNLDHLMTADVYNDIIED